MHLRKSFFKKYLEHILSWYLQDTFEKYLVGA